MGEQENGLLDQAMLAGNWWRFIFMCLVVYGFIPRLLTFIYSKYKLTDSISQAILGLPGLHLLSCFRLRRWRPGERNKRNTGPKYDS